LTRKTNQISTRNHGDVVEDEDGKVKVWSRVLDSDCCRNDRPEDVADSRGSTAGTPADSEEVVRVYALSATLSCRLDASCDSEYIVRDCEFRAVVGGKDIGGRIVVVFEV
jgi:hypothetical protein